MSAIKTAWIIWLAFFTIAIAAAGAAGVDTAFDQANKLYEQGHYQDAAVAYQTIIDSGKTSAALYFNWGNACFKSGQTGRALVAYRQAENLAPRDPDVRANLRFARKSVTGGADIAPLVGREWLKTLSINEWTWLVGGLFWALFLMLAAGQWRTEWQKPLRRWVQFTGLGLAGSVLCLGLIASDHFTTISAVVIVREGVARQGPLDESRSAFALRDGMEVTVMDQKQDWIQVKDSIHRIGWMKQNQVVFLKDGV